LLDRSSGLQQGGHGDSAILSLPAIIVRTDASPTLSVAGLPVLDRLLVACHRAGFSPLRVLSRLPLPDLPRTKAWSIPFTVVSELSPTISGKLLFLTDTWLVQTTDLQHLLGADGRLASDKSGKAPIGLISAQDLDDPEAALARLPCVASAGVLAPVRNEKEAEIATRQLWNSITSSTDGFIDRWFNRPIGRLLLSKRLILTPISPNQISVASILVGLAGAWLLAKGTWASGGLGALLFQASAVIDCVDGDVARIVFKESAIGKWLDIIGDQIVHGAIFVGIALGLSRTGDPSLALTLGAASVAGGLISFLVVLRALKSPELKADGRFQRFLDGATSRDFSVLVLLLAIAGRLDWFLWMAAVGSNCFWIACLALQFRARGGGRLA